MPSVPDRDGFRLGSASSLPSFPSVQRIDRTDQDKPFWHLSGEGVRPILEHKVTKETKKSCFQICSFVADFNYSSSPCDRVPRQLPPTGRRQ